MAAARGKAHAASTQRGKGLVHLPAEPARECGKEGGGARTPPRLGGEGGCGTIYTGTVQKRREGKQGEGKPPGQGGENTRGPREDTSRSQNSMKCIPVKIQAIKTVQ
ncbi:Hypothetical predicted protein [Pelobates cultripes]|uniref:Uncharacterized protein n=1 Tax=Pelobates cultripes TaxID=61616 RepID=A0AAD1R9T7_PELCU|nr:Hypothetical predicted protein [Pelobates cultripes]